METELDRPGPLLVGLIDHFSGGRSGGEIDPAVLARVRAYLAQTRLFGEEMGVLWEMLELVTSKSGRRPGAKIDEPALLNLACGPCREAAVLSAFFGQGGKRVKQFAMDLREGEVEKAKHRYEYTERLFKEAGVPNIRSSDSGEARVTFIADDATRLVGYGQIPETFDTIFIRHQNFWNDRAVWARIFEFALARIEDDGLLVITSYFDREHLLALEMLKTLGGRVLASERNPQSRPLDYPGKSVDRHVAAIAR